MTGVLRDPVLRIELYGTCRWMESGGWGFLCLLGPDISEFTFLPSSDSYTILEDIHFVLPEIRSCTLRSAWFLKKFTYKPLQLAYEPLWICARFLNLFTILTRAPVDRQDSRRCSLFYACYWHVSLRIKVLECLPWLWHTYRSSSVFLSLTVSLLESQHSNHNTSNHHQKTLEIALTTAVIE